jgi:hypothetical protein
MTNKCRIVLTLPSPTLMQLPPRLDRVEPPLLGKDGKEYRLHLLYCVFVLYFCIEDAEFE